MKRTNLPFLTMWIVICGCLCPNAIEREGAKIVIICDVLWG